MNHANQGRKAFPTPEKIVRDELGRSSLGQLFLEIKPPLWWSSFFCSIPFVLREARISASVFTGPCAPAHAAYAMSAALFPFPGREVLSRTLLCCFLVCAPTLSIAKIDGSVPTERVEANLVFPQAHRGL